MLLPHFTLNKRFCQKRSCGKR